MGVAEACLFHEDLKKRVEKHDEEIGEIKERLASGDEKLKTLDEIKRGQTWAVQLTIGTLITVVMTLFTVLFKLKGGG
jgi:ABC-type Fe3+-citrate transport system substrate-binding protein